MILDKLVATELPSLFDTEKNDVVGHEVIELTDQMRIRETAATAHRIGQALILLILASMPVLFGAVQAWLWSLYTVGIYSAFIFFTWETCRTGSDERVNGYGIAVGLFFAVCLFACLPLPGGLMQVLSPVRHHLLKETQQLTGMNVLWRTLSYAPFQSFAWWAFLLGLWLLFIQLKTYLASSRMLEWSIRVLLVVAVVQGLYGILQALVPSLGVLWVDYLKGGFGDARGTWINRNHFAGYMGMMLPLMLGFSLSKVRWGAELKLKTVLQSERIHQHSLFLLMLVVMALALLFSKSRAGIMAAFIGIGFFLKLVRGRGRKMPAQFWIIVGVFLSLTLLYGLRIGFSPIIERFMALDQGNSRLDYWKDSLVIISGHPFGIGLASFKYVFPVYNVTSMAESITPHYLHNDVLQLLVETGWPGAALLLSAFLVFMVNSFSRIRRMSFEADPQHFFVAAGAYSGIVSLCVHSFFDFNLQIPANAMYFVVLMAMVRSCVRHAKG